MSQSNTEATLVHSDRTGFRFKITNSDPVALLYEVCFGRIYSNQLRFYFNSSLVKVALVPQWSMIKLEVLEQLSHSFVRVIT